MKYPLLIFVCVVALHSCRSGENMPEPGCLTLVAPAPQATIDMYGTTFRWSGCSDNSYHLVASYSSDYSAPFIDESVSADSFVYGGASDGHFSGGRMVYWKVISTRGEAQGVFNTPDYSASFAGVYAVEVKKYNYEFGQYTLVGTYTDSLRIVDLAGDSIQVINPVINTPNKGQYLKNCSTEEKAGYLGVWGNNTTTVNYLIAQDILSVSHYTGGLGYGIQYVFTIQ